MPQPVLLIAPEALAAQVAAGLRRELDVSVDVAGNRRAGLACLRRGEYVLVLLDEAMAEADADALYSHAGDAPVLELNFAITGVSRAVRQVKSALARRARDRAHARAAAAADLQRELGASLSGLLLESQLALRDASPQTAPKLRHLVELAGDLRERLRAS